MRRASIGVAVLGIVAAVTAATLAWQPAGQPADQQPDQQSDAMAKNFANTLMSALKQTEGCFGADAAKFQSGRYTIVAWFKDKASVVRWYNSPSHKMMMMGMGTSAADFVPLEHVEDPNTPVMVMATMAFGGEGALSGPVPISQISIEMYTPLPGGAMANGRLAPKDFPIPEFDEMELGKGR